jgi:tellurite methyltransferase
MNREFWTEIYKRDPLPNSPSSFAEFAVTYITSPMVELGCGNGRDLYFFKKNGIQAYGVDAANEGPWIIKQDVSTFIKQNESSDCVYTRFFWHAIERSVQLEILQWTKKRILIEARTKKDKPLNVCGKHSRVLVDVPQLKRDLEKHGFKIIFEHEGTGMSYYQGEDPHLIRIVADKT